MKEFDTIIGMTREYFINNLENTIFELPKGVITTKLGIGTTKTEVICKSIANEYPFIQNSRGKLIIERNRYDEWLRLVNEKNDLDDKNEELVDNYPELIDEIKKLKEMIEHNTITIQTAQMEIDRLKAQIDIMNKEISEIDNKKKELNTIIEQIEPKKLEIDKLKDDIKKQDEEYEKLVKKATELEKKKEENKNLLTRRPIKTEPFYYWDSILDRIMKGYVWFFFYFLLFNNIIPFLQSLIP